MNITKHKMKHVCNYIVDKSIRDVPTPLWNYVDVNRISLSLKINHTKVKIIRGTHDAQISINYLGTFDVLNLPEEYTEVQRYQIDTLYHVIKKHQSVLVFLFDDDYFN